MLLIILGTFGPVNLLFTPEHVLKRKLPIATFLGAIPIALLAVTFLVLPEPDTSVQFNRGDHAVKVYKWKDGDKATVKRWISEKQYSSYEYQDRVKWIPDTLKNY